LVEMLDDVTCSNGLAWTSDRRTMYYIDTMTRKIDAFNYDDADGQITNRRTAITIPQSDGYPDGMTIDAEDKLWIAFWGPGQVRRYDPKTGEVLAVINVAATQTTSCTFGGAELDTLYITSARETLDDAALQQDPLAGGLFCVKPGVCGVAGNLFAG
jgi:sugar lactone lactonase YvrE